MLPLSAAAGEFPCQARRGWALGPAFTPASSDAVIVAPARFQRASRCRLHLLSWYNDRRQTQYARWGAGICSWETDLVLLAAPACESI